MAVFMIKLAMVNWETELYQTPWWLFKSFVGVVLVSMVLGLCLAKTRFVQQFIALSRISISRNNAWKGMALFAGILILLLLEVRFRVLNTIFFNGLYTSLEKKEWAGFWLFAIMNLGLIGLRMLNFVLTTFLDQVLQIAWLGKLNRHFVDLWFARQNYYHKTLHDDVADNIDQTIQLDLNQFIDNTSVFVRGLISSVMSTIEFSIVLWGLSGAMVILGWEISHAMVFIVFIYAAVATGLALKIGMPLIKLNFFKERLNGNYRYGLVRTKEYAESIAFYQGEASEKRFLSQQFQSIIHNRWQIVRRSMALKGLNYGFTESVKIFPLMLQAPRYFANQITLGDMYQSMQSFTRLQEALSFFREFYEQFTAYHAQMERLYVFLNSMQNHTDFRQADYFVANQYIQVQDLSLALHDGAALLNNINFELHHGDRLLIQGPSGCGKTSLLKTLAKLWPYHSAGKIGLPEQKHIMFVPQRIYVPQGTLQEALHYPYGHHIHTDEAMADALKQCALSHLIEHLHHNENWGKILSLGELQRLAFARIILQQPKCLFLDEATSALDENNEAILYNLLLVHLPNSIIVSVGHRPSLHRFHNRFLDLSV